MLPGGIRLGINSNGKLKTILVKIYVAADLDETVTQRVLLPMVLRRGTAHLTDMQVISRDLEGLYGAGFSNSAAKVGEWHITKFRLEVVNDLFLPSPENLFEKGLEFLRQVLCDPLEVDGAFHRDYVEQEKVTLQRSIEALVDDKSAYASFRCTEEMCRDEPYRLNEQGQVEHLAEIQPQELFAARRRWFEGAPMAIYIAGDLDVEKTRATVERIFRLPRQSTQTLSPLPPRVPVGDPREVRERLSVNQGKLVLGFRHGVTYTDDRYEAFLLMNGILGGFSHSKLFQNVREKASLAYYASSWPERTKRLLFVGCGIGVKNYEKALKIILEQVEAMKQGDITDEEIDSTVKTILNSNLMLEDNFSALADVDYVYSLHGREVDLDAFRRKLKAISKESIVDVARELEHDTTYFLHN